MCVFLIEGHDQCQNTGTLVYYWCFTKVLCRKKKREIQIFIGKKKRVKILICIAPFQGNVSSKAFSLCKCIEIHYFWGGQEVKNRCGLWKTASSTWNLFYFCGILSLDGLSEDFEILILLLTNLSFLKSYSYESLIPRGHFSSLRHSVLHHCCHFKLYSRT